MAAGAALATAPTAGVRSAGWNSYFPIPYAKHCKVTSSMGKSYYHINYRTYESGTTVESFTMEKAGALKEQGAARVVAYCTHPVLSGSAVDNINASVLDELVVTDTIPLQENAQACEKIRQLSIAAMLAETMRRISMEESVSSLYMD